jgi:hypothetical protein
MPGDATGNPYRDLRFAMATDSPPVPHVPENTRYFDAGPVRIGIEYRLLNESVLAAFYGPERAKAMIEGGLGRPDLARPDLEDQGLSVHIFDAATGAEHLRFDDLDDNKHYHYLRSDGRGAVVFYDYVSNGEFLDWVFATLTDKVSSMLTLAGEPKLAAKVDRATFASALEEARGVAAKADASQRGE